MLNKKTKMLPVELILILCFLTFLPSQALAQECWYLSPFYGYQGDQDLEVEIFSISTSFTNTTDVSFDNPGITVIDTVVNRRNKDKVTVRIDIEEDAPIGRFNITITTGSEVIVCEEQGGEQDVFEVRQKVTLGVGYAAALPSSVNVPVPFYLENLYGPLVGGKVAICSDNVDLSYSEPITAKTTDRTAGFAIMTSVPDGFWAGCFRLIFFDITGNSIIDTGDGPIFTVDFDVSQNAPSGGCRQPITLTPTFSCKIDVGGIPFNRDVKTITETGDFCFIDPTSPPTTTVSSGNGGGGGGGGGSPDTTTSTTIPDSNGDTTSITTTVVEPPPETTTTTSIEEETTSTTTTRKFLWPLAYEKLWGVHRERNLSVLRAFRDEILLKNDQGMEYVSLLYGNSIEIVMLLLQDSALQDRVRETVDELLPHIESLLAGDKTSLSGEQIARIESLLNYCDTKALSPRLKKAVKKVRKDLSEGVLLKQFGISVHD